MPTIDANAIVLDLEGAPLRPPRQGLDGKVEPGPPMTIGQACIAALLSVYPDEAEGRDAPAGKTTSPLDAKVERFKIASRLARGGDVVLTAEDVAEVKRVVGKFWSPLIVGRVLEALDPAALGLPATTPAA